MPRGAAALLQQFSDDLRAGTDRGTRNATDVATVDTQANRLLKGDELGAILIGVHSYNLFVF